MLLKLSIMLLKNLHNTPIMLKIMQAQLTVECLIGAFYINECSIGVFYLCGNCSIRVYKSFIASDKTSLSL